MFFKFLIISILIIYIVARFWGFIYRVAGWFSGKDEHQQEFNRQRRKQKFHTKQENGMEIHIPNKKRGTFDKGDYVDFEEVKE
ncbi:MAG: DUF4834 family protein [Flammeovirgaceae bacterium]|nr:DUF4834 family protein [Flammeovirgaceae bacterium]